jgi:hypothetical protein
VIRRLAREREAPGPMFIDERIDTRSRRETIAAASPFRRRETC